MSAWAGSRFLKQILRSRLLVYQGHLLQGCIWFPGKNSVREKPEDIRWNLKFLPVSTVATGCNHRFCQSINQISRGSMCGSVQVAEKGSTLNHVSEDDWIYLYALLIPGLITHDLGKIWAKSINTILHILILDILWQIYHLQPLPVSQRTMELNGSEQMLPRQLVEHAENYLAKLVTEANKLSIQVGRTALKLKI